MSAADPAPIEVLDRDARSGRLTLLARLTAAPFPFEEPEFFQAGPPGDRQRTVAGNTYGERHYRDDRVLIHLPPGFDPARPAGILLYLHGHFSTLRRDVFEAHRIPEQVDRSGANVLLIAPQMARDAADSHPGRLSQPGGAARLLAATGALLCSDLALELLSTNAPSIRAFAPHPDPPPVGGREPSEFGPSPQRGEVREGGRSEWNSRAAQPGESVRALTGMLATAPVVVAAFSGGYRAAADCLTVGGLGSRVAGCVLIDALYGRIDAFAAWRLNPGTHAFLAAIYGDSTRDLTLALARRLHAAGAPVRSRWPRGLDRDTVAFARVSTAHSDMPLLGPPRWPVTQALRRWASGPAT